MAVKEIPVNFRVYYSCMKDTYTQLKKDAIAAREEVAESAKEIWDYVYTNIEKYKKEFNVNLLEYNEFVENKYEDGTFLRLAKGMFINRKNDYLLVADLFELLTLAKKQKSIADIDKDIDLYNRILSLNLKAYNDILRTFYQEVHKRMILNGEGYVFEGSIGWTCINRCHLKKSKPCLDFAATKKRKAEILAQGKRIRNKEEEEWHKKNGLPYEAEDCRVWLKNEYCYEIPLLDCKLPNGSKYKLEVTDYRSREIRGLRNNELLDYCKNDKNKICELQLDLRSKLNLCNEVDKMLYLNFIRNENQEPSNATTPGRKNR